LASNQEAPKGAETAVYLGSLDGRESRLLLRSFDNAAYSKSYLFFMRNDILMAQRFDLEKETLVGEPVVIATNVLNDINTWSAVFSVSEGLLAYQSAAAVGTQLTWLDRCCKQLGTPRERDRYDNVRISPQADRVAVSLDSPQDIWIYDV